jgi:hypothetical protein
MRKLTLEEIDREIAELERELEIGARDLGQLKRQRSVIDPAGSAVGKVLAYMQTQQGQVTKGELLHATGLKADSLSLAIVRLKERGEIRGTGWGVYVLTDRVKSATLPPA